MKTIAIAAFDPVHDAALLNALGYVCRHYDANLEDVGGPESGPHLVGHNAFDSWERMRDDGSAIDCIIVVDGEVVDTEVLPAGPDDQDDQDDTPF